MKSRAQLRLLADYFAATRNEIAIDEMFLSLSKMDATMVGHFPRVPHWIAQATRHPYLTRTMSRMVRWIWLSGGAVLYFIWEYLKYSRILRTKGKSICNFEEGAILGLSNRVSDIVTEEQFPVFPRLWLTLPWVPLNRLPENARELPIFSILEHRDLISALLDAVTATRRMQRQTRLSVWVLQTYTAFRWLVVRRAIDRLSGTLIMAEHYDRWAVLVDRSVREHRRNPSRNVRMVVVQHGTMGALSQKNKKNMSLLNLPTRLHQIDELYAYSGNEADAFKAKVLPFGQIPRALVVHFFKPVITLSSSGLGGELKVLFVGHPLCENFHLNVFHELIKQNKFEAYYKPHPKSPMSGAVNEVEWVIIDEDNTFPKVDLLISYPSTLVVEYEGLGVPASIHPLNATAEDLVQFVNMTRGIIQKEIRKRRCAKISNPLASNLN